MATLLVSSKDPWRNKWLSYDPLANVGFFNPKETNIHEPEPKAAEHNPDSAPQEDHIEIHKLRREDVGKMYIPVETFQQSMYCYLRDEDEHGHERAIIEAALEKFASEVKSKYR